MDGRAGTRLDRTIYHLLNLTRNMSLNRLNVLCNNKVTSKQKTLKRRHHEALKMLKAQSENPNRYILTHTNGDDPHGASEYYLFSQTDTAAWSYVIGKSEDRNCPFGKTCPFQCILCDYACVHQFTCTCYDSLIRGNFCKHIHFVIRSLAGELHHGDIPALNDSDDEEDFDHELVIDDGNNSSEKSIHLNIFPNSQDTAEEADQCEQNNALLDEAIRAAQEAMARLQQLKLNNNRPVKDTKAFVANFTSNIKTQLNNYENSAAINQASQQILTEAPSGDQPHIIRRIRNMPGFNYTQRTRSSSRNRRANTVP